MDCSFEKKKTVIDQTYAQSQIMVKNPNYLDIYIFFYLGLLILGISKAKSSEKEFT